MRLTRVDPGPAMLWSWDHKDRAMAAVRGGVWVVGAEPYAQPCHKRWPARAHWGNTALGLPSPILSSYPHTKCRARLTTCSQREMHQPYCGPQKAGRCAHKWTHGTHGGVAGGGMRAGLSPPIPSSQDTWNMQNSDWRNSESMEGEGQGKNELSNSIHVRKMLCWGRGRVTSVVVLSLIHDRHCLNTK